MGNVPQGEVPKSRISCSVDEGLARKLKAERNASLVMELALRAYYAEKESSPTTPKEKNWCGGCRTFCLNSNGICPSCHKALGEKP